MVFHRIALVCAFVVVFSTSLKAQPGPQSAGGPLGRGNRGANNQANQGIERGTLIATYDPRTNTVVISGPTTQVVKMVDLAQQLDKNPVAENETHVYRLKNGSALNIEAVANMLFNGTGGSGRSATAAQALNPNRTTATQLGNSSGGGGGPRGGTGFSNGALGTGTGRGTGGVQSFGNAGSGGVSSNTAAAATGMVGQVSIVADPNTNSLLVTTSPGNWPSVRHILDELDRSVPQVLIKVLIAEVTHSNGTDLGADLSIMNLRLDTSGSLTEGQKGSTIFGSPSNGGFLTFSESNFSATIHALQSTGKIDVLSRPYILATDNQLATITVGQTVPYVSNSQVTAQGNTINTVAYSNVGILLDVIPHINPDGMVIMDVAPEISALADSTISVTTGVTAPVFNTRSAQSRVAVQNGQTAVIGGLMQDQVNSTINKVPLIGDIPFLGTLFQRKQETKTKTELLIFLTPHVAMNPDQLQAMGDDELKTTKLVPNAVSPGTFQEQQKGLDVGSPVIQSVQPSASDPEE